MKERMNGLMTVSAVDAWDGATALAGMVRLSLVSGVDGLEDWSLVHPGAGEELWTVCLHGHGSHGDQLYVRPDIRKHWLPSFQAIGGGIVTPNLRDNAWMSPAAAADLHDLLNWIRAEYGARRFLFCSGSMGGTASLIYAILYPEDVAGVVVRGAASDVGRFHTWCCEEAGTPIGTEIAAAIKTAYGFTPEEDPALFQTHSVLAHASRLTMPLALSHGGADKVIPPEESRRLATALAGEPNFRYWDIQNGNHDSPLFNTEDLDWVLERIPSPIP